MQFLAFGLSFQLFTFGLLMSAHASHVAGVQGPHEVETNAVHMDAAPAWVTRVRVDKVIDHIQMVLEWDIRRINVYWHSDQAEFAKGHGKGPLVMAYSLKNENAVHIGPRVNDANFNQYFGHELVHIIAYQKYKEAIPKWLEEGLANYLAKTAKVDYRWMAGKPYPKDPQCQDRCRPEKINS